MLGRYKREVCKLSFITTGCLRRTSELPKNSLNDVVTARERRNKAIKRESWCRSNRVVNGPTVKRTILPSKESPRASQDRLFSGLFLQREPPLPEASVPLALLQDNVGALIKLVSRTGAISAWALGSYYYHSVGLQCRNKAMCFWMSQI